VEDDGQLFNPPAFLQNSTDTILALVAHVGAFGKSQSITADMLRNYWSGGISPGDWRSLAKETAGLLRGRHDSVLIDNYASLWFKGRGQQESGFAQDTKRLVEIKNDDKHDRGPKTPHDYDESISLTQELLDRILDALSILILHPIRMVQSVDTDWLTDKKTIDTLLYVGDHPGMRPETKDFPRALTKEHLYIELMEDDWAPLYPLISVQYCPSCKMRETYMIDRWERSGKQTVLKSYERGHLRNRDDAARQVGEHLESWISKYMVRPQES